MKRAIDIVILPEEEVRDLAMELNLGLNDKAPYNYTLGMYDFLPHITLFMAVLDDTRLEKVKAILAEIVAAHMPIPIEISGTKNVPVDQGTSYLEITKTSPLQNLHEEIVARLAPLCTFEGTPDMFVGELHQIPHYWATGAFRELTIDKYNPHISLGYGNTKKIESTFFTAEKLTICQLGAHNTCRKIL